MKTIKLAIADDQNLFLKGLRFIIQTFENVEIVAEAADGQELLEKVEATQPPLVQQKGHNLVVGNGTCKKTNTNVSAAHKQQSQIAGPNSSMVYWTEFPNRNVIG